MENFDRLVDELERQIIEQARATYSDKVVEEFYYLKNLGRMPEPDACGIVHGWCGDTMEIYLRLNGEQIKLVVTLEGHHAHLRISVRRVQRAISSVCAFALSAGKAHLSQVQERSGEKGRLAVGG
jgi:hypothetical protein